METSKTAAPKYTTVGSIYNPSSAPLQPPARRGRAVKWPLHADLTIAKSALLGASFAGEPGSPPSVLPPLHYSPLQQNYDRAVSPVTTPNTLARTASSTLSASAMDLAKHDDADMSSQSDQEDEEEEEHGNVDLTKQMSVKTLTNLASYENPMQRAAQKMLSRARTLPLSNTRNTRSDPVHPENLLQSDGASDISLKSFNFNYDTILAKGPGAPRPLTAGPPGLRQHKSLTTDAPAIASQVAAAAHVKTAAALPNVLRATSRQSQNSSQLEAATSQAQPTTALLSAFNSDLAAPSKMIDTLTAEEASKYYPKGLPNNFSYQTKKDGGLLRPPSRDLQARREKTNQLWYAGNEMLCKTMDIAIAEKNHEDLKRTLDIATPRTDERSLRAGVPNRKMSVQEAIATPTKAHAAPLLSLAFQTLINHPEFSAYTNLPKFSYSGYEF
jgi:hypothetical protein